MGYTAQTTYGKIVLAKIRSELVVLKTFNQRGEVNSKTLSIPVMDVEVAVGNYNAITGKKLTQGGNTFIDIVKTIDLAINEVIDGKVASEVSFNIRNDRLASSGYVLANSFEVKAIEELEENGTIAKITKPTKTTIFGDILNGQLALDILKIPKKGRILLIKPAIWPLIKKSPDFIQRNEIAQIMLITGQIGEIDGLPVIQTNEFTNDKTQFIIYQPQFCHIAYGFSKEPEIVDLTNEFIGSSAVAGRMSGGIKISRAKAVYTAQIA